MYILGFETTGPICSVALLDLDDPSFVCLREEKEPMGHLKHLAAYAEELMREYGIQMREIAAVASSIGPGSFTGIRIGVTTARAVAQALGIPCVAVPTLDAFRCKSLDSNIIVPIINARRGQVYGAIFSGVDGKEDILPPGPYMLVDVLDKLKAYLDSDTDNSSEERKTLEVSFYGDGIDAYWDLLTEFKNEIESKSAHRIIFVEESERYQSADMVVRYALDKYKNKEVVNFDALLPDYMRKAEAEQKLEDGTLKKLREEKLARLMKGN